MLRTLDKSSSQYLWRILNQAWRVLVVRFCFLLFGVGGLVVSVTLFPAFYLLPGGKSRRRASGRAFVNGSFAMLTQLLIRTGVMRLHVEGAEFLQEAGGKVILANHPTYIDVVVLQSMIPACNCIVKAALWDGMTYGRILRTADYVRNDEPETMISDCAEVLRQGQPLLIFPEGTRTTLGEEIHFLRGSAHILLAFPEVEVVPVLIWCTPPALTKSHRWYQVPAFGFDVCLKVLPSKPLNTFISESETGKMTARLLTKGLEQFFMRELSKHVGPS